MRPVRKARPEIADPERFRRHLIGAVDAYIAGDGADLVGHLDQAAIAMHAKPQQQVVSVVRRQTA